MQRYLKASQKLVEKFSLFAKKAQKSYLVLSVNSGQKKRTILRVNVVKRRKSAVLIRRL